MADCTYAIADKHGRCDLLKKVLDWVEADRGREGGVRIVFLDDYIDRDPPKPVDRGVDTFKLCIDQVRRQILSPYHSNINDRKRGRDDMDAANFEHALAPTFIEALRKQSAQPGWWRDVLDDPKLIVAVRGRSLSVYWQGQALFNVTCPRGALKVTTHEKFLTDPALAAQVPLRADGTFDTSILLERGFVSRYDGLASLKKLKATAGLFAGEEKRGCHEIAVRNSNVIDVEIAFPGRHAVEAEEDIRTAPRVDLAALVEDGEDARLVFWEAKTYKNGELRALGDNQVPVCGQIAAYSTILAKQRAAIESSMARVAANLVAFQEMGWQRELSPLIERVGKGEAKLRLGEEPQVGLIIFGFDAAQRDSQVWKEHRTKLEEKIRPVRLVGDAKNARI